MVTDWKQLADDIGEGGTQYARRAFDEILGDEWIESTVEHAISWKRGNELAMNCLWHLCSLKAAEYAYRIYKASQGERANRAVWLIKQIAHPASLVWVEEFLNDNNVIEWGLGLLDQLLWRREIHYNEIVASLLQLAERNSNGQLDVQFIKEYLREREST